MLKQINMMRLFHNLKNSVVVALLGVAALTISCDNGTEDPEPAGVEIAERLEATEGRLITEVALLQALIDGEEVAVCEQGEDGAWTVTFADEQVMTVSCVANANALAVVEENGGYYWATIKDGEAVALTDANGAKIAVADNADIWVGKDADGKTYVSFDGGNCWIAVTGEFALFTNVVVENNTATFTLTGGKSFTVTLPEDDASGVKVEIGEITCNATGSVVYVPLTFTDNATLFKVAYINDGKDWTETWGGSPQSAAEKLATAYMWQYGEWPLIMHISELENNSIVVENAPAPGQLAHILIIAMDDDGNMSRAAYTTYTPVDELELIYADEAGYEYGKPNMSYAGVVDEDFLSFTIEFTEGTDRIWVNTLDDEYTSGRYPYELVELMTSGWMSSHEMTESGSYSKYYRNCIGSTDYPCALIVTWKDKNGIYHEAFRDYEVIEAAKPDIDRLSGVESGDVDPR